MIFWRTTPVVDNTTKSTPSQDIASAFYCLKMMDPDDAQSLLETFQDQAQSADIKCLSQCPERLFPEINNKLDQSLRRFGM